MLDRTGSSVGSSALCSRRMQIRGQGQRRPKGVLRCKGQSGRKELDVKKLELKYNYIHHQDKTQYKDVLKTFDKIHLKVILRR